MVNMVNSELSDLGKPQPGSFFVILGKVKSAFGPSGSSGQSLSRFL